MSEIILKEVGQEEKNLITYYTKENTKSLRIGELYVDEDNKGNQTYYITELIDDVYEELPITFEKAKSYFLYFTDNQSKIFVKNVFCTNTEEEFKASLTINDNGIFIEEL